MSEPQQPTPPIPLTNRERFLCGALGGLAPTAVYAINSDIAAWLAAVTALVAIAVVIKVVIVVCIGGFVSWAHRPETSHWRAIVIGISAPALITTYLAGNQEATHVSGLGDLVNTAFAAETASEVEGEEKWNEAKIQELLRVPPTKEFKAYREDAKEQFLRGFLGSAECREESDAIYLSAITSTEVLARKWAIVTQVQLRIDKLDGDTFVYTPTGSLKKYLVVVENLDASQFKKSDDMLKYGNLGLLKSCAREITISAYQNRLRDKPEAHLIEAVFDYVVTQNPASARTLKEQGILP